MARQRGPFDAVQFTRESAERIAGVVRTAELAVPAASPLKFDKRFEERAPKQVRAAAFSGAWPIGSAKIVTLKYLPTATVNAVNLSWPITSTAYVNEDCLVGKEGTNWWLVVPVLQTATAVFVTQTTQRAYCSATASSSVVTGVSTAGSTINYVSDISVTATLNTTDCSISVGTSKSTGSANVVTSVNVSTGSVTVVSATATAVFIASSITSQYLRLRVP